MSKIKSDSWFDAATGSKTVAPIQTLVEGEITADRITNGCTLAFGIVTDCEDPSRSEK